MICRGGTCDTLASCGLAGSCLYRSSAEEARELHERAAKAVRVLEQRETEEQHGDQGGCPVTPTVLPVDSAARKDIPIMRGVLDYFPAALAEVAELSRVGNDKHNPGEDLHWARGKSSDHADCIVRHLMERGRTDTDGLSHSVKVAWRALALLQEELESQGAPMARGARLDP
jgi:hypothetical protein